MIGIVGLPDCYIVSVLRYILVCKDFHYIDISYLLSQRIPNLNTEIQSFFILKVVSENSNRTSMECRFLGIFIRIICLAVAGVLFIRGCWRYLQDESSTQMEYRKFHETKRDTYPTITICIWNDKLEDKLGLYDREKLNKTYGIKEPGEYINFLEGHIWEDKMIEVDFDDVTLEIKDRIIV